MSIFLDPTGKSTYGIGLCARCSRKFSLDELRPDPNYPGLMVCKDDADVLDPYRLPARMSEQISLEFTRPDLSLALEPTSGWTADGSPLPWSADGFQLQWTADGFYPEQFY